MIMDKPIIAQPEIQTRYRNFLINKWMNVKKGAAILTNIDDVPGAKEHEVPWADNTFFCNGVPIVTKGKFSVTTLPDKHRLYLPEGAGGYLTHSPWAWLVSEEDGSQYSCIVNLKQDRWYDREVIILDDNDSIEIDPIENSIEHYIYPANCVGRVNNHFVQQDEFYNVNKLGQITLATGDDELLAGQRRYFIRLWRTEGNEPWLNTEPGKK